MLNLIFIIIAVAIASIIAYRIDRKFYTPPSNEAAAKLVESITDKTLDDILKQDDTIKVSIIITSTSAPCVINYQKEFVADDWFGKITLQETLK